MNENPAIFLFPHILKCAGLSMKAFLQDDVREPAATLVYSEAERDPWLKPVQLVPQARRDALRVIFGHRLPRSAKDGFEGRPVLEVGLLRDPTSWCVSMYNFLQTSPDVHRVRGVSFERWYGSIKRNRISRFYLRHYFRLTSGNLRMMSERNRFDFMSEHFDRFWFVGDYRNSDDVAARISQEIGVAFTKLPRENAAPEGSLRVQDLSPMLKERILTENAVDQALYDAWSKRLWDGNPNLAAGDDLPTRWTWNNIAN